jgi:hypothetical protein
VAQRKVESPFVGLVPYTEQDAPFFFGRERDQQRILANLFASRLTILYGASGVGKSSVLRAGIVNEVRQRIAESRALGETPEIAVIYFKDWKGDILAKLRAAISAAMLSLLGKDYLDGLAPSLPLDELLVQAGARFGGDVLLILDQFEEYFLYRPVGAPDDFAVQLAAAANRPGLPANFVLALRDDSIARLDRFKPLIPNLFANYLRIHHLTGIGARDAIFKPVEHYNELSADDKQVPGKFTVEAELVEMVIEQSHTGRVLLGQVGQGTLGAGETSDDVETPYFQLVMTRLWREEVQRASHVLRASTLRELGGAETIIRTHLENALAGLTDADREICARLFPHLVTPSGSKIAHTGANLAKFAKSTPEVVKVLLGNLAGADKRILSIVAPADRRSGEEQYEIYHDSLAQAVLTWQARYDAEADAKVRAQAKHRVVVWAVSLGIAFVIAAVAAGVAIWQNRIAEAERSHAVAARQRAEKAEADALLLKSQADQARLVRERADALRLNNAKLVEVLQSQIDSAKREETQYKQLVAAKPGTESKAPAIADVIRERDTLRNKLVMMEKQGGDTQRQYQATPTKQEP